MTYINGLRDTKWGKNLIKNAIKSDGAGGAVITFKGAKANKKNFIFLLMKSLKLEKAVYIHQVTMI